MYTNELARLKDRVIHAETSGERAYYLALYEKELAAKAMQS